MAAATKGIADHLRGQLEELRASYYEWLIAPRAARHRKVEILFVFEVGTSAFALPVTRLVEVVRAKDMVAVPCAPRHIAGAIVHRQEVTSVLNLRTLLALPDAAARGGEWVLVLQPKSRHWALLADATVGVRTIDSGRLYPSPESDSCSTLLRSTVVIADRAVGVLDSEALSLTASSSPDSHDQTHRSTC